VLEESLVGLGSVLFLRTVFVDDIKVSEMLVESLGRLGRMCLRC